MRNQYIQYQRLTVIQMLGHLRVLLKIQGVNHHANIDTPVSVDDHFLRCVLHIAYLFNDLISIN